MDKGLLIGLYIFEVCVLFILGVLYLLFGLSDVIYISLFVLSAILTNMTASNQICSAGVPWNGLLVATFMPLFLIFMLIAVMINSPMGSGWLVPFANTFGPILYGPISKDPAMAKIQEKKYNRISKIIWYFLSALLTLSYSLHSITALTCAPSSKEISEQQKEYIKKLSKNIDYNNNRPTTTNDGF